MNAPSAEARSPYPTLPRIGDVLASKYSIERVIGQGGMCVVFAAMHAQLRERVAIKLLNPEFARRAEAIERFMREGRVAIRIRSEHVVRILDVDALDNGDPYIVMEYLEGSDLEALIAASGPSPVAGAVDSVLQAGEAIAEAHALGIVHRDLKPANLFLTHLADGSPWIKVLDFGISKTEPSYFFDADPRLTGKQIMGSPQYMSPEQLRSTCDVDLRADLWSLGAILFELLTCAPPFGGGTVAAVCTRIQNELPPSLLDERPDAPLGLARAVARCLAKDPDARYQNMAELAEALAPYASPAGLTSVRRITGIVRNARGWTGGGMRAGVSGRGRVAYASPSRSAARPKKRRRARRIVTVVSAAALGCVTALAATWLTARGESVGQTVTQLAAALTASPPASPSPASGPANGVPGAAPPRAPPAFAPSPAPALPAPVVVPTATTATAPSVATAPTAPAASPPAPPPALASPRFAPVPTTPHAAPPTKSPSHVRRAPSPRRLTPPRDAAPVVLPPPVTEPAPPRPAPLPSFEDPDDGAHLFDERK